MENNNKQDRPVLESAQALKGKKAAGGKKPRGKLLVLVLMILVLAAAAGVYYGTDLLAPEADETQPTETEVTSVRLIERAKSDLDSVTIAQKGAEPYTVLNKIEYDEEGKAVEKEEGDTSPDYEIADQPYFSVKASQLSSMMSYAAALTADSALEEVKELSEYGLDQPSLQVDIAYKDGSKSVLYYGDKAPTGGGYYARMEGDERVFLISSGSYSAFNKSLNSLHTVELPATITSDAVNGLLIEQEGKETIEFQVITETDDIQSINSLKIVQPVRYDAHSTRASELLESVCAITIKSYAGHAETEEELAQYGLTAPRAHILLKGSEGQQLDVHVGDALDKQYYVTVDDTGDVYLMDSSALDFLGNVRLPYLIDQFINLVNITSIDGLTIQGNGESYALGIERVVIPAEETEDKEEDETAESFFFDGEVTEEKKFKGLYQSIIGTLADKVSDDMYLTGDVAVTVTYHLTNGKDFVIEYLEYNDEYYAARREGLTLLLIKKDKVNAMLNDCAAYREGTFEP